MMVKLLVLKILGRPTLRSLHQVFQPTHGLTLDTGVMRKMKIITIIDDDY